MKKKHKDRIQSSLVSFPSKQMNYLQKYFRVCRARSSALESRKTRLMRYRFKILIWLWTVNYGTMRWRVRCWQVGEGKIKREERRWTLKLNSLTKPSSPVIKSKFARWWPHKGVGEPGLALNATSRLNFTAIASSAVPPQLLLHLLMQPHPSTIRATAKHGLSRALTVLQTPGNLNNLQSRTATLWMTAARRLGTWSLKMDGPLLIFHGGKREAGERNNFLLITNFAKFSLFTLALLTRAFV